MRLLADMGISPMVVAALNATGHDACHIRDLGLSNAEDERNIELAASMDRIVVTHDLDFGRILALSNASQPSLVTLRLSDMRPPNVTQRLLHVLGMLADVLTQGVAVSVTDGADRYRLLPLGDLGQQSAND